MITSLNEFKNAFAVKKSVLLLEGKRTVVAEDCEKLILLGNLLASNTSKVIFRSGNAPGADQLFCEGVARTDHTRIQVVTPYTGHRQKLNKAYETISLDEINLMEEPEIIYQSKWNRKTEKLVDQYVSGDRNAFSMKAAYIIRDTIKVLGAKGIQPASFAIFYDDLENPRSGGTGHTMLVCEKNGIPFIDQSIWFDWLRV